MRHNRKKRDGYRKVIEDRLADLLQRADIELPVATIKSIIFEAGHTEFRPYLNGMLALFAGSKYSIDQDLLLLVIQDAWSYFPHCSLNGFSPSEMMDHLRD